VIEQAVIRPQMEAPARLDASNLPAILTRASARLLSARDSAEVLEAKNMAEAALHYAKVTKAANETHADCLRIITRAEMRMANEIDKGQATGGVARAGNPNARTSGNSENRAKLEDLGVTSQRVAEWRKIRDAGEIKVESAISTALSQGRAPTKRDIRRVVDPEFRDADFQAEADAAARDIEIERDERIALAGADDLVAENEKLTKQVAALTRRVAALIEDNGSLKYREKMWRERAIAAGWKGRDDA
jgi:hypothetical protein